MTNIASKNFSSFMPTNSFPYVPGKALSAVFAPPTQAPTETVTLSAQAQEPKLYEGLSDSTASVKVGVWGKSENGCIEDILINQGYSRKEIYTKDAEGQNMLQQVARANNLKDPNVVAAGFDLKVPSKLADEDTAVSDTKDGNYDDSYADEYANDYTYANDSNYDNGYADDFDYANEYANGNGNSNAGSSIVANNKGVSLLNQGNGDNQDNVISFSELSEESRDGYFENKGRKISEFFGFTSPETEYSSTFTNATSLSVQRQADGKTEVTGTVDGEEKSIMSLAGDSDDGLLESAGQVADKAGKLFNYLFGN